MKTKLLYFLLSAILFSIGLLSKAQVTTYIAPPYSTGFESGVLDANWFTTSSTTGGRIQIWDNTSLTWSGMTAVSHTGNLWLGMDASPGGSYVTNESWIGLNLAGTTGYRFSFWWAEWNDEYEPEDGLYVSDNGGTTFTKVFDLNGPAYTDLSWQNFDFSLDSINLFHGLTNSATYVVKIQQRDNYYFAGGNDGFLIDDIDVYAICSNPVDVSSTFSVTECESYTSPSGNYTWTSSNTYFDTIPKSSGCGDSLLTINLTILDPSTGSLSPVVCDSYTSPSGNYIWTVSNTYLDTIPNAVGCDSMLTINLTVLNSTSSSFAVTACDSYVSPSGKYTWTSSNTYLDTIPNAVGCDSLMTIDLSILNTTFGSITENACDSFVSPSGTYTWLSSGTYADTLLNSAGCDSIISVNLTISNAVQTLDQITACDSLVWIDGNTYFTNNNNASVILNTVAGCDSVVKLDLTIANIDVSVDENAAPLLSANQSGAGYQWVDCDNGNTPIAGETNQSFTATETGNYAVVISSNGCSDTSTCISVVVSGIRSIATTLAQVYPNPTTGIVYVELIEQTDYNYTLSNIAGQTLIQKSASNQSFTIDLSNFSTGIYFLELSSNKGQQVIKLVKE